MNSRKKSKTPFKGPKRLALLFLPVSLFWMEIIFRIFVTRTFSTGILFSLFFSIMTAMLIYIVSSFFPAKVNRVLYAVFLGAYSTYFCAQVVYHKIFKVLFNMYSMIMGTGQAFGSFWKQALLGILYSLHVLVLIFVPFILFMVFFKKHLEFFEPTDIYEKLYTVIIGVGAYLIALIMIIAGGRGSLSPYSLYYEENVLDTAAERLGLITAGRLDAESLIFNRYDVTSQIITPDNPELSKPERSESSEPSESSSEHSESSQPEESSGESSEESSQPEESSTPEPKEYGYNVLDIAFDAISEKYAGKKNIVALNEYFAAKEPTRKNEYTGIFKDCNLIYIVAESFSSYIVDEERTPTLYKMANEGFVFNNFYTGLWGVSTLDGEYVADVGLIPKSGVWSLYRSAENYLPFCLGNMFNSIGVTSRAYHPHTYTYYHRDSSHPNMGYIYKGKGNGLDVRGTWPESDLEMMELTIPEYINDERFHTYYMTVSGHMNYSWIGNYMSSKHKKEVIDLPYCEEVLAYYACNMELENAMTYLLEQLESAGKAENTVIVISADHYPYGMEKSSIDEMAGHVVDENFEIYENTCIIYKKGMEPVIVDKPCSSLDLLPTVLNLFGFDYDSRLLSGQDILSDSEGFVLFNTRSFITENGRYIASTGKVEGDLTKEEIDYYSKLINTKYSYAAKVLDNDYYRVIFDK